MPSLAALGTLTTTWLLVALFHAYLDLTYFFDVQKSFLYNDMKNLSAYDYIVVGGGTAGAILASRLAEDGRTVLLVEAGGMPPPFSDIPLLAPALQKSRYDWQYETVSQSHACKGLINNKSSWPMGKILGGTSRLNYMAYVRGHPEDYREWFSDFIEPTAEFGGPLNISNLRWATPLADAILNGLKEMKQPVTDINEGETIGFMKAQLFMEDGKRWSSDRMLHGKAKKNLKVLTHSYVDKILFESNVAVGVEFLMSNERYATRANKGVILSAGAIGSPKILMLSGIGPKEHLHQLNISTMIDLPVGKHLIDHILTGLDLVTLNASVGLSITDALNPLSAFEYFLFGEGPWTSSGIEVLGTVRSSLLDRSNSVIPDLQLMALPLGVSKDRGLVMKRALGISDKLYKEYFAPLANQNAVSIAPVLLHPKSSGELRLRSKDSFDPPIIDPKYLTNAEDVATLIEGLEFVTNLVKTPSMRAVGASIYKKSFPGCEDEDFGSRNYWECYIRHLTLTSYHPAGTCRMGDVVDESFRVYGTANLYVIDASVFPHLPSANIQAAVIMLAEKAGRILRNRMNYRIRHRNCYKIDELCNVFGICTKL